MVSSDLGFAKKARNFAEKLDTPLAFIEKRRIANDAKAEGLTLIGDVKDRDVILVDDEVDTGVSMVSAVRMVKENGCRDVYMTFVHPILSLGAEEKLAELPVKEFVTTDTIPMSMEKAALFAGRLRILSVSNLLAEVIQRANEGRSVGELFGE